MTLALRTHGPAGQAPIQGTWLLLLARNHPPAHLSPPSTCVWAGISWPGHRVRHGRGSRMTRPPHHPGSTHEQ